MMLPSSLPAFEIPTGLMATGLNGLRGFGRGLGAVSVGPLAQAQFAGQLHPDYLPTQYFQAGYSTTPQALPTYLYATQGFAQQVASLLGGTVVSAPPPGDYQGTGIPNAYQVQLPDGSLVLPGNLFPPGVILSFQSECDAEASLVASIPGAQLSATCSGGGTGTTPTQLAVSQGSTIPVTPGGQSTIIGYTAPPPTPAPIVPITTSPVPVTVANPTGQPVAAPVAPSCSNVGQNIAAWQASGLSNAVIWNHIVSQAPTLVSCSSVQALNPNAPIYAPASPGAGAQPGDTGDQGTATDGAPVASTSDNTMLYVGLAVAVGLLVVFGGKS